MLHLLLVYEEPKQVACVMGYTARASELSIVFIAGRLVLGVNVEHPFTNIVMIDIEVLQVPYM